MAEVDPNATASRPQGLPGGGLSLLKFVEAGTGLEIELEPFESKQFAVKPLDFVQLISVLDSERPTFPVEIRNARALKAAGGVPANLPLVLKGTIQSEGPPIAFGLVDGGWLPMPWANKRIALLDRNVVIKLEKLQASLGGDNPALLAQWLGLDTETVSPLLFAFEGSRQRLPTEAEINEELSRAQRALATLLPGAKVQQIGPVQSSALYRMVLEQANFRARATQFLLQAAPLVFNRAQPARRLALENTISGLAAAHGVRRGSLAFLAVVSCIYDGNPPSTVKAATPGRAVLKPKANYTLEDAYNALADLSFLEFMFNAGALFTGTSFVLYTADAGLGALWAALHPCERELAHLGNGIYRTTMTFNMAGGLFPSLSDDEVQSLANRISGASEATN